MKLSANSLGIFIFTTLATVAFIWMAKRPATEENQVMQFGMPLQAATTKKAIEKPELVDEKPIEETLSTEEASSVKDSLPTEASSNDSASSEPEKTEDDTNKKADSEKK